MESKLCLVVVFVLISLFCLIPASFAHECYVCENQESNHDKCVKTTRQCKQSEDSCKTTVVWTVPPEWTRGGFTGDRRHYIYKECMNYTECLRQRTINTYNCTREWYEDWECVDCCRGDMCNYYVTLGASSLQSLSLMWTTLLTIFVSIITFGGLPSTDCCGDLLTRMWSSTSTRSSSRR